jgi:hypothetical protein
VPHVRPSGRGTKTMGAAQRPFSLHRLKDPHQSLEERSRQQRLIWPSGAPRRRINGLLKPNRPHSGVDQNESVGPAAALCFFSTWGKQRISANPDSSKLGSATKLQVFATAFCFVSGHDFSRAAPDQNGQGF